MCIDVEITGAARASCTHCTRFEREAMNIHTTIHATTSMTRLVCMAGRDALPKEHLGEAVSRAYDRHMCVRLLQSLPQVQTYILGAASEVACIFRDAPFEQG